MKEDLSIYFRLDEHALIADYYPQNGNPIRGIIVVLDEGAGNDADSDIVSDKAIIDVMRSEINVSDAGDEIHINEEIWVVTGSSGADKETISLTAEKRRRPSYA